MVSYDYEKAFDFLRTFFEPVTLCVFFNSGYICPVSKFCFYPSYLLVLIQQYRQKFFFVFSGFQVYFFD